MALQNGERKLKVLMVANANSKYINETSYQTKASENWSVLLVTLICIADLCFQGSDTIMFYVAVVAINIAFTTFQDLKRTVSRQFPVSYFEIWYLIFNFVLFVYGVLTVYNSDGSQYSLFNHILIVLSMFTIARQFQMFQTDIFSYLKKLTLIAIPLVGIIVLAAEWSMLLDKIPLILQGASWYRLGNKNGWNPNSVALHIAMLSIFLNYVMANEKKKKYVILEFLVWLFGGFIILLTGSKKGIVLLILPLLFFSVLVPNRGKRARNVLIGLILVVAILYLIFNNEFFYNLLGERIIDMLGTMGLNVGRSYRLSTSTEDRSNMISVGLNFFWQKPLLGNGWGYFYVKAGFNRYSHNNFVEILCSMGIFGFIFYYSFPLYLLFRCISRIKENGSKVCIAILILLVFMDFASVNCYGGITAAFVLCLADKFAQGIDVGKNYGY